MDDITLVGTVGVAAGAIAGALGTAAVAKLKAQRTEDRADMDGANAAWQTLFREAKKIADDNASKIVALEIKSELAEERSEKCEEQHAKCEERCAALESRMDTVTATVCQVESKINGQS